MKIIAKLLNRESEKSYAKGKEGGGKERRTKKQLFHFQKNK